MRRVDVGASRSGILAKPLNLGMSGAEGKGNAQFMVFGQNYSWLPFEGKTCAAKIVVG
jgi:hypothetical protein